MGTLREQGVPEHLVWLLENAYDEQFGEVMGEWGKSRSFSITGGVRQGCVLSPRLFSAVLEWALSQWKTEIGNASPLELPRWGQVSHFVVQNGVFLFPPNTMVLPDDTPVYKMVGQPYANPKTTLVEFGHPNQYSQTTPVQDRNSVWNLGLNRFVPSPKTIL